jgi:hypothetical protein
VSSAEKLHTPGYTLQTSTKNQYSNPAKHHCPDNQKRLVMELPQQRDTQTWSLEIEVSLEYGVWILAFSPKRAFHRSPLTRAVSTKSFEVQSVSLGEQVSRTPSAIILDQVQHQQLEVLTQSSRCSEAEVLRA